MEPTHVCLLSARFEPLIRPPCFAVGPNRTKVVTPNSSLKFTPEELLLYCRDLRVICFLFDRLTPDAQVIEVSVFLFRSEKHSCEISCICGFFFLCSPASAPSRV